MTRHAAERVNMWQQLHFHFWKKERRSSGSYVRTEGGGNGSEVGQILPSWKKQPCSHITPAFPSPPVRSKSAGSFGEGNGYPLQYSCLEDPLDRGAWRATVHGVTKSQTRLRDSHFHFHFGFAFTSHYENFQQMRKARRTV